MKSRDVRFLLKLFFYGVTHRLTCSKLRYVGCFGEGRSQTAR